MTRSSHARDETSVPEVAPRSRRRAGRGAWRLVLVTAVLGALLVTAGASPAAATTTTPAQIVQPNSSLNQVACLDTTTCYAVGQTFAGPGVLGAAAIFAIINGVASPAQTLGPGYSLNEIVCYDGTTCVAYGGYRAPGSTRQDPTTPIRVVITNGVIGAPEVIPHLFAIVGCATAAYCVGVTTVRVDTVPHGAFVVITNGVYGVPQLFPHNVQGINDIACPSANTCYAVGQTPPDPNYPDPIFNEPMNLGVVVPIVGGVVGTPEVSPAANQFFGVGCASPTTCYAIGPNNSLFEPQQLLVPIVNGIPGTPVPFSNPDLIVTAISCMTAAVCEAVGFTSEGAVVVPVINGLPGATHVVTGANGLQAVACSVSNCVAIGGFNPPGGGATIAVVVFITEPDLECNGQVATSIGTPGVNRLLGTPGNDSFLALGGNDSVYGYGGDDNVCAGAGNDVVYAGTGNDWVEGGAGNDTISGEAGNDNLMGGDGSDRIFAGAGADQLNGGPATDYCYKGPGTNAYTACEVFPAGM